MRKCLQSFGCWYIPYILPRSWWQTVSDFQLRSVSKTRCESLRYSKSHLLSAKYKCFVHTFTNRFPVLFLVSIHLSQHYSLHSPFFSLALYLSSTTTSWPYRQKVKLLLTLKTTFQETHATPRWFLALLNCTSVLFSLDCLFFSIVNTL